MLFWGKFQIITSVLFLRVGFLSPLFFTLFPTMVRWGIFDFCVKINPQSFETAIGLFWAEWSLPSCANQFFGHLLCLHGSIAFQEPWRPRRGFFCCSKEYQYEISCGKPGHETKYESLYVGFIILLGNLIMLGTIFPENMLWGHEKVVIRRQWAFPYQMCTFDNLIMPKNEKGDDKETMNNPPTNWLSKKFPVHQRCDRPCSYFFSTWHKNLQNASMPIDKRSVLDVHLLM